MATLSNSTKNSQVFYSFLYYENNTENDKKHL